MILVDSSVWAALFSSSPGRGGAELRRMIQEADPFALTGVVVAEVLQGLTRDSGRIEHHGTTTLFAALNVLSGEVLGGCMPRHRLLLRV